MKNLIWLFIAIATCTAETHNAKYDRPFRSHIDPQYIEKTLPNLYPIDHDDDIYNKDFLVNPNSRIVFNFEHARRDQPNQVEKRIENIRPYVHRVRTTPAPRVHIDRTILPDNSYVEIEDNHSFKPQPNFNIPQAPSFPHWDEDIIVIDDSEKNAPILTAANRFSPRDQEEYPLREMRRFKSKNRGQHKYNVHDIEINEFPQFSGVPTNSQSRILHKRASPPPPVPTLSPWFDGFGK